MKHACIFLIIAFFATPTFANISSTNLERSQAMTQEVFAPNNESLVFLNCFNNSEIVKKACKNIHEEMDKKWPKISGTKKNVLFRDTPPGHKKYISVEIGGSFTSSGLTRDYPDHIVIVLQSNNGTFLGIIKIENIKDVLSEISKLSK